MGIHDKVTCLLEQRIRIMFSQTCSKVTCCNYIDLCNVEGLEVSLSA